MDQPGQGKKAEVKKESSKPESMTESDKPESTRESDGTESMPEAGRKESIPESGKKESMPKSAQPAQSNEEASSITAQDYIHEQLSLEKEARMRMPYDPDKCTYELGPIRQEVYACLTCSERSRKPCGVCFACSIRCHSTHRLVELFTKREYACDCGTERTAGNGKCKIRYGRHESRPSSRRSSSLLDMRPSLHQKDTSRSQKQILDVPSMSNTYNQNFRGLFCSCKKPYNPMDDSDMFQCQFGQACGEDWYHEECLMGLFPGVVSRRPTLSEAKAGENRLETLSEAGIDAESDHKTGNCVGEVLPMPEFPSLDTFETIVCWKCVQKFPEQFARLASLLHCQKVYYVPSGSLEERRRLLSGGEKHDNADCESRKRPRRSFPYTILLGKDFKSQIRRLVQENQPQNASLVKLMKEFAFMYEEDPIYKPPEDTDDESSSIFEMGMKELSKVPVEQAITGMEAYEKIKSKLTEFLKPFAEQKKVVTKDEVTRFFDAELGKGV